MNRRLLIVWVGLFLSFSSFGQNEANYWFFGLNAGINFNTAPPTTVTDGALVSYEGSAAICSPSGQLLFYTNGEKVWDAKNQLMPNGAGLLGNASATQSSIIIPRPGHKQKYFIFTLDQLGGSKGLRYSEVDMAQNHGDGDIISKNIPITSPLSEKLTAIRHKNGTDYWVLVHGTGTGSSGSSFYAYKITENGPASSAVTTEIGNAHTGFGGSGTFGYMKFSPNGKKVVCAVGGSGKFVELFDFDDESGSLSNSMSIDGFTTNPYGVEFSPDSKRLYVTAGKSLYQYSIPETKNTSVLKFSQVEFTSDAQLWALQLAPNHKIYICKQDSMLGVINNPNNEASSIGYVENSFSLGIRSAVQGFPNSIQNLLADNFIVAENNCVNQPTNFNILLNGLDSISWDFGDATAGNANRSKGFAPSYIYKTAGAYYVTAVVYNNGNTQTINQTILVKGLPAFSLGNDTTLCKSQSLPVKINLTDATYLWNNGSKLPNRILTTPGIHFVDVTLYGCTVRDSVKIAYNIVKSDFTIDKQTQCFKNNQFKFNTDPAQNEVNIWQLDNVYAGAGKTLSQSFAAAGEYKVTNIVTSTLGCIDSTIKTVTVNEDIKANFTINVVNNCGPANRFKFTDNTTYSGGYDTEFFIEGKRIPKKEVEWNFANPGTYSIKIVSTSNDGCSDLMIKQIIVYAAPEAIFDVTTNGICDINNSFVVSKLTPLKTYETIDWTAGTQKASGTDKTSFSFTTAGKHKISATVTNAAGCKITHEVEVEVFPSPMVNFTTSQNSITCLGNKAIEFVNNTSCAISIAEYSWDFGDNTTSTLKNPVKDYSGVGASYLVSLSATNDKGCKVTAVKTITTFEKPSTAISVNDIAHCESNNSFIATFTNNNPSATVSGYNWEDETGKKYYANPLPISFATAGEHILNLKVTSTNGCEDFAATTIKVYESPKGDISVNTNEQCLDNNAFVFKASMKSAGAANYVWSLGNKTKAYGPEVTASYNKPDNYNINLEVLGQNGCRTTFTPIKVIVHPTPSFQVVTVEGCDKQPANLKIQGLDNSTLINEWYWDLGDGQISTDPQPKHVYPHPGLFPLAATATSNYGCSYTAYNPNGVRITESPTVNFSQRKTQWGFDETLIEFTPEVSGDVKTYFWDFGNGITSTNSVEKVNYEKAGYYYVSLEGKTANGCANKIVKQVLVVPPFDAYVPTSFTPNGDGKNDEFGMDGVEFIKTYQMQIFNRWGQEIFSSTQLNYRWDGRSNGVALPSDIYSYVITITDAEGRPYALNGTIYLMR